MKNTKNARTNLPTITVDDVAEYLIKNSSKNHKVSRREITMEMARLRKQRLNPSTPNSQNYNTTVVDQATRKKVNEILDDFTFVPLLAGITIVFDYNGNIADADYDDKIYYAESLLDETQVNILQDAIAVYPYIERNETQKIIDALNRITPKFNEYNYNPNVPFVRKYRGTCYKNLVEITKAFSKYKYDSESERFTPEDGKKTIREYENSFQKVVMKIRFKYNSYDENKTLQLRKPPRPIDGENDAFLREVNPARLMWVNGYYYLVTYSYNKENNKPYFINYRVDRMSDVVCTDTPAEKLPASFNEEEYRYKNPVMYSTDDDDRKKKVVIKCKTSLMNNVIDTFGMDVYVQKIDKYNVKVTIRDTAYDGIKMWALEYYFGCEILEPESLRNEMRAAAEEMLKKYPEPPETEE